MLVYPFKKCKYLVCFIYITIRINYQKQIYINFIILNNLTISHFFYNCRQANNNVTSSFFNSLIS